MLLTPLMQKMMISLRDSKGRCDFSTQIIYKNNNQFYHDMNRLEKYTFWIRKKAVKGINGRIKAEYALTIDGMLFSGQLKRMKELSENEGNPEDKGKTGNHRNCNISADSSEAHGNHQ